MRFIVFIIVSGNREDTIDDTYPYYSKYGIKYANKKFLEGTVLKIDIQ